jgi:hypothetical protein
MWLQIPLGNVSSQKARAQNILTLKKEMSLYEAKCTLEDAFGCTLNNSTNVNEK